MDSTSAEASQRAETMELSHAQRMIWAGQQLSPGVPLYNMALAVTITGDLDVGAFQAAFQSVVDASDALRTSFTECDGQPQRLVHPELAFDTPVHDLTDQKDPTLAAQQVCQERAEQLLDTSDCLFDSALLRTGPSEHVWFFNQHHLITDAWSTAVLYRRLVEAYGAAKNGEATSISMPAYQDFIDSKYQHAPSQQAYWLDRLASDVAPPSLYSTERRHPSTRTERLSKALGNDRSDAFRQLARRQDLAGPTPEFTLFNMFATLLTAWMWRVSGQEQLGLGTLAHNRATAVHKETPGLFVELFPLLCEVAETDSFRSLNDKARREALTLIQHARPGASVPEFSRTFNTVLNYVTATLGDFDGLPVQVDWIHPGHGDPGHHLRLQVHDFANSGEFVLHFDFNVEIFDERSRQFAVGHFLNLLDAMIADPERTIADVDLLTPAERREVLDIGEPDWRPSPGTTVSRFEQQVARNADRVAVQTDSRSVTYEELDQLANGLARRLIEQGAGRDQVVAICTERSVDMIVAILGIQKAGAAYLPLEPSDPADRRRQMLAASSAIAVVAHGPTASAIRDSGLPLFLVDEADELAEATVVDIGPEDLAYVLFTSGSTGAPKPIMIEHRNVLSLVDGLHDRIYRHHPPAGDQGLRIALVAPYVFDPSVQQIFGALLQGHCLYVVPEKDRADGSRLFDFLDRHQIDLTDGTPGHIRLLADGSDRNLGALAVKHFIIGGEALPPALVRRFLEGFGEDPPAVTNAYGPAECCVDCIAWPVTASTIDRYATIPIGKPLPGERAYILNESDLLQPFGVVGELCLGGTGVGRGYLGDADLTAERFVEDPFAGGGVMYRTGDLARKSADGVIEFMGRADSQVKVRGHRVELEEVEGVLESFRVERTRIPLKVERPDDRRCRSCVLTERHPGVSIDAGGTCSVCREFERVRGDILDYFRPFEEFERLARGHASADGSGYDCLLLYSGGKDSSYVLYRLAEMGLRVLAYTFDNGHISQAAFRNIERQTSRLGVDSVVSKTSRMDEIFLESLNDDSTVCSGCFRALTTISTRLADDHGIGLVITGLSRGQIFDTKLAGLIEEGVQATNEIEEKLLLFRQAYHANKDRSTALLEVDVEGIDLSELEFVDFFRYDDISTAHIQSFLRDRDSYWHQPKDTGFCSSNCRMNDVGIAVHSQTQGYHNYEAPLSWDVRLGIADRDTALAEVGPVRNVRYINNVLDQIGYLTREIHDAAVVVHQDDQGSNQLWAYYVASQSLTVSELRHYLGRTLPDYMIPARFFQLDEIPLTPNGKVDRDALRPDAHRPELGTSPVEPRTPAERILATVWSDVLALEQVGVHDNFFELGGDSINAIQIVARARQAGIELSPWQLLDNQTIASLAEVAVLRQPDLQPVSPNRLSLAGLDETDLDRLAELLDD